MKSLNDVFHLWFVSVLVFSNTLFNTKQKQNWGETMFSWNKNSEIEVKFHRVDGPLHKKYLEY